MPRARAILQSEFPYNISARCINKEWFNIPMPKVWEIFCEELTHIHHDKNLQIHMFILMSNHFHMIASTPDANISECMQQFMYRSSRRLTNEGNRINETFAGRHYKCILHKPNYYLNAYKYNYRNPVKAGICLLVEDYPYSTLQKVLGKSVNIPLVEDTTYNSDPFGTLKWLNTVPDLKKLEVFRLGLKHQYFQSRKCHRSTEPIISEKDLL